MSIQKQDMESEQYKWSDNSSSSVFSGQPSRRLFDRFNGDQVLFIINSFASLSERFTLQDAKMVEYDIINYMPMEPKSEISVFNWLQGNRKQG